MSCFFPPYPPRPFPPPPGWKGEPNTDLSSRAEYGIMKVKLPLPEVAQDFN